MSQDCSDVDVCLDRIGEIKHADTLIERILFRDTLESEEAHIDWLETQLELIGKNGIANHKQTVYFLRQTRFGKLIVTK